MILELINPKVDDKRRKAGKKLKEKTNKMLITHIYSNSSSGARIFRSGKGGLISSCNLTAAAIQNALAGI